MLTGVLWYRFHFSLIGGNWGPLQIGVHRHLVDNVNWRTKVLVSQKTKKPH